MESEDDMHDANEVASVEEDDNYYSGGEDEDDMDEAAEDYNYGYDDADEEDDDDAADYDFIANSDDGDDALVSRSQVTPRFCCILIVLINSYEWELLNWFGLD